jgi:hypothetical protein
MYIDFIRFFDPSVIKRLTHLLTYVAQQIADSAAACKQAESAHRHLQNLSSNEPSV